MPWWQGSTYQGGPPAWGLDEMLPLLTLKTYRVTNHLTNPRSRTRLATRASNAGGQLAIIIIIIIIIIMPDTFGYVIVSGSVVKTY